MRIGCAKETGKKAAGDKAGSDGDLSPSPPFVGGKVQLRSVTLAYPYQPIKNPKK
jgi:hypothetical protein